MMTSGQPLRLHTGDAKTAKAIVAKLETSKEAAGEALQLTHDVDDAGAASSEEEEVAPPPTAAPPKSVSWADAAPASPEAARTGGGGGETCVAAYDFEAQGDDELTITEGERLTVLERENDEWWLVRNAHGSEGVVPAAYVEISQTPTSASSPTPAVNGARSQADIEAEAAASAAAAETARREEQVRKEEERRAIEEAARQAAREREEQEAADREIARQIQAEEQAKRRHAEEESHRHREEEAAKRREAARRMEPPKVSSRPSAQDVAAAARSLPSGREKTTPRRPSESNRPKPNPARVRVWSDRTGQFKVEAEFLGLNGNKIRLHKMNGVIIEVPLDKMSAEDTQMIKRHMARQKSRHEADDDDVPLGKQVRKPSQQMSQESRARGAESSSRSTREAPPQQRRPRFDWFAFFLDAGCDMDDCTRYAANFDRDRIDETILEDLDSSTMSSLGLRAGDVIRVRKLINQKFAKKTPEQLSQIHQDEEYARKLQEHENKGGKGPAPVPPPGLFTNPDGKLANNTRRGRPERKNTGTLNTVDTAALSAASEQLSKVSLAPIEPTRTPPATVSPAAEPEAKKEEPAKTLLGGFDDDAWTIKPSAKPKSPAPVASPTTSVTSPISSQKTGTDALLAQIQQMRPASAEPPKGGDFDVLAGLPTPQQLQQQQQQQRSQAMPPPQSYGLGAQNTSTPMSQIQQQQAQQPQQQQPQVPDPNAPRGPIAPVRANEGLLNPLQPAMTGMFVPTHNSGQQQYGMMAQPTGMMQQGNMMPQAAGMMSPGFQQQMQPAYTGYGGFQQPQQQNSTFNAIANLPPPQLPQQTGSGDKFAPTNIFAAMKRSDFGKPEEQNPQAASKCQPRARPDTLDKYDALRPLTTGYNGAPGMMPQMTGMPMQMQQTGMMGGGGMGGGMGMMPNMTGYNPQMGQQMGYMGQNPYGQY